MYGSLNDPLKNSEHNLNILSGLASEQETNVYRVMTPTCGSLLAPLSPPSSRKLINIEVSEETHPSTAYKMSLGQLVFAQDYYI